MQTIRLVSWLYTNLKLMCVYGSPIIGYVCGGRVGCLTYWWSPLMVYYDNGDCCEVVVGSDGGCPRSL